MALDLVTKLTSWENLMHKNNTTTSGNDISSGLNERVQSFLKGIDGMHSRVPLPNTMYPVIFTELVTTPELFAQIGNSANRNVTINFNYVAVIDYGLGSEANAGEGMENSDLELIKLTQNMTALLRQKITLSSTVDDSNIDNVLYDTIVREPKIHNGVATINMTANLLTT